MPQEKRYMSIPMLKQKYGFGRNYWDMICEKIGCARSSEGKAARRLVDEVKYIAYIEASGNQPSAK